LLAAVFMDARNKCGHDKDGLMHTIATADDVAAAVAELARAEPRFGAIAARTGLPAVRRRSGGMAGLLRIVVDQQISLASGAAIWGRLEAHLAPFEAAQMLAASDESLRACGLSGGKVRTLRAIAAAVAAGSLDFGRLEALPDDEASAMLTSVHGIGPWTADIYLLSCLGRSDVWPVGDLALQAAAAAAFDLAARPTAAQLRQLGEPWRPWRAVAARLLWAHYRQMNGLPAA
jgi:DNA-3-methyladenine glycosylase II